MLISCKYSNGEVLREKALIKASRYEYSLKVNHLSLIFESHAVWASLHRSLQTIAKIAAFT